jgi:hypothetical protein
MPARFKAKKQSSGLNLGGQLTRINWIGQGALGEQSGEILTL